MAILNLAACRGYQAHAAGTEVVELGKGARLVVAFLVACRECTFIRGNHIIFELAHSLKLQTGGSGELAAGMVEDMLGRTFNRTSVLVEVAAEHGQSGQRSKGVDECGAETRQHIKVGIAGLHKVEERRTVDTLAKRKYGFEIAV